MCYIEIKPSMEIIMSRKKSKLPDTDSLGQLFNLLGWLSRGSSENTVLTIACLSTLAFLATLTLSLLAILVRTGFPSCPVQAGEIAVESYLSSQTQEVKSAK